MEMLPPSLMFSCWGEGGGGGGVGRGGGGGEGLCAIYIEVPKDMARVMSMSQARLKHLIKIETWAWHTSERGGRGYVLYIY